MSDFLGEEERTVQRAGRSLAFYIPKPAKQYVEPGDVFKVSTRIENGEIEITARRKIFNFDLNDLKTVVQKHGLKVKYDGEVEGTRIVEAVDDKVLLKAIQSKLEQPLGLIHVVLTARVVDLSPRSYAKGKELIDSFKSKFDISFMPEGDADSVKLLEHPEYYLKDASDLFNRLEMAGKKLTASITVRFDNKRDDLKSLDESFQLVKKLERTIAH